jgi:hypothetical protein
MQKTAASDRGAAAQWGSSRVQGFLTTPATSHDGLDVGRLCRDRTDEIAQISELPLPMAIICLADVVHSMTHQDDARGGMTAAAPRAAMES